MTYGKDILTIVIVPGEKGPDDHKILVEGKPLSIKDILKLVRLMAENERAINREKIDRNNRFFFGDAVCDALYGKESIDAVCKKYLIPENI